MQCTDNLLIEMSNKWHVGGIGFARAYMFFSRNERVIYKLFTSSVHKENVFCVHKPPFSMLVVSAVRFVKIDFLSITSDRVIEHKHLSRVSFHLDVIENIVRPIARPLHSQLVPLHKLHIVRYSTSQGDICQGVKFHLRCTQVRIFLVAVAER